MSMERPGVFVVTVYPSLYKAFKILYMFSAPQYYEIHLSLVKPIT